MDYKNNTLNVSMCVMRLMRMMMILQCRQPTILRSLTYKVFKWRP
ncbi:hypothetical protein O9992_01105 [Vibrio lentus]|nr:hypothetical protein [Vibrio lentus]